MCRVKPEDGGHRIGGTLKIRKGPRMRSSNLHFGNVPHPWALPIIKHEAKFIMNHIYVDHKVYEWEVCKAYSSIRGGFLHL
jgi:hypothetical protein